MTDALALPIGEHGHRAQAHPEHTPSRALHRHRRKEDVTDYGVLLGMRQQWAGAEAAYRRTLALNPLHAQAHNNLGQILERSGTIEDAAAEYRLALESRPSLRRERFLRIAFS